MKPQQVRIIGGQWRSRQITVLDMPTLRPTPNRVRETLFNWLRPYIQGARCLDLFAGSGALSFEALSQGAAKVVCIEQSKTLITQLHKTAEILKAENIEIVCADAIEWLQRYHDSIDSETQKTAMPFDIVFLDPPYNANLLAICFQSLEKGFLGANARIYFEHNKPVDLERLPNTWQILNQKKAGAVYYYLAQVIH
jgi:16S rRNA (guanine966-N2)-methyltransferase